MQLETLSNELEEKYREFLLCNPRSLIYATVEYRDFLRQAVGGEPTYILALDGNEKIVGALAYFKYEAPGVGTVINSLPWYGSHGGCVIADDRAGYARKELLECYRSALNKPDVLSATLIMSVAEEVFCEQYRKILLPAVEDRRIGQVSELPAAGGDLEYRILQKTRNLVRKALKQNFELQVRDDEDAWRFLYQTHVENMQAMGGKCKPWQHFIAMQTAFPAQSRKLFIAALDGIPVAALLLLYFNRTVEYITPVIKQEHRSKQPLSFLIWHAMQDAITFGYRWWNWGGTWESQRSLHHFKAGWGAMDHPYTYLICSSDEGKEILSKNREKLGELFPYYYTYPFDRL